jgi:DNA-binding CsgD family transcriptional regulator
MAFVTLAEIAMQESPEEVLRRAVEAARRICDADAAFVAVRDDRGDCRVCVRHGFREPDWDSIVIASGRGISGLVLADRRPRTCHDYDRDRSFTRDFAPLMARERLRAAGVVPIDDLTTGRADPKPLGLIAVTSTQLGAPGDQIMTELHRAAEMAAVGLQRVGRRAVAQADSAISPRELQVLRLLEQGCSNAIIARRLIISETTVKAHLRSILRKLGVCSRLAAVAEARRLGIL